MGAACPRVLSSSGQKVILLLSRYLPLSPEEFQWGQGIPSSGREELLPTSPHSFESPLSCANQQKAVWGKKPDPAVLVKVRVSLAWHCI